MHEIYRTIAIDIHRDRVREADRWHLAQQFRQNGNPTPVARLRERLVNLLRQRPASATIVSESSACRS